MTKYILKTQRTKNNMDKPLYVAFDVLPLDIPRPYVEEEILNGLSHYCVVESFELLKNPYFSSWPLPKPWR